MYIAFHLTFHSNIVNNNMFQYLIMFMFCKQFLLNASNYKNINFYEFDHAHICISHENVMTELQFLWQNLKFF